MVCDNCGSQLDINMRYCPYCGKENIEAARHLKEMEQYDAEFAQTKNEVIKKAGWFSRYYGQATVIVVLVLAIVSCFLLMDESYSIEQRKEHRYFENHRSQVLEEIKGYYDARDYYGLYTYFHVHQHYGSIKELSPYEFLGNAGGNVYSVYENILAELYGEKKGYTDDYINRAARSLVDFYGSLDKNNSWNEKNLTGENQIAMAQLEGDMAAFLKVYCNFSEEDIEKAKEMKNTSEMSALLLRRLTDEEKN